MDETFIILEAPRRGEASCLGFKRSKSGVQRALRDRLTVHSGRFSSAVVSS